MSAFGVLSDGVMDCSMEPGEDVYKIDSDTGAALDMALRANPHFSLLALVGLDGDVVAGRIAPINSNRHILPRRVEGERLLGPRA